MPRKFKFFLAIFLFIAGIFVFHEKIISFFILYETEKILTGFFGSSIKYSHIECQEGALHCQGITAQSFSLSKEDRLDAEIDSLDVSYEWNFRERTLTLNIDLIRAHLILKGSDFFKILKKNIREKEKYFFFKIIPKITFKDGLLKVKSENKHIESQLLFSFEYFDDQLKVLNLNFLDKAFSLHFAKKDLGIEFKINAHLFPLKAMNPLFHLFFPKTNFFFDNGFLEGSLSLKMNDNKPFFEGDLKLKDFSFNELNHKVTCQFPCLEMSFDKNSLNPNLIFSLKNPLKATLQGTKEPIFFSLENLEGFLDFDKKVFKIAKAKSCLELSQNKAIKDLKAEISLTDDFLMDAKLYFLKENQELESTFSFKKNLFDVNTQISHEFFPLDRNEANFLLSFASHILPNFSAPNIISGIFSGSYFIEFGNGFEKIQLKNLNILKGAAFFPELAQKWSIDNFQGEFSFLKKENDFGLEQSFAKFEHGFINFKDPKFNIEDIRGSYNFQNGFFNECHISFLFNQLRGRFQNDPINADEIHFSFHGKADDFLNLTSFENVEPFKTLCLNQKASLKGTLCLKRSLFEESKACCLFSMPALEKNPLEFEFLLSKDKNQNYFVKEGQFKILELPLKGLSLFADWQLSSKISFSGSFKNQKFKVIPDFKELLLENNLFKITLARGKEDKKNYLEWDFAENLFLGLISINELWFTDKINKLEFASSDFDVELNQNNIVINDLSFASTGAEIHGQLIAHIEKENIETELNFLKSNLEINSLKKMSKSCNSSDILSTLPFDGSLAFDGKAVLTIPFDTSKKTVSSLNLHFFDALLNFENAKSRFREVEFKLEFDERLNHLFVRDLQGILFIGGPRELFETPIFGSIESTDVKLGLFSFDLKADNEKKLFHLKGETRKGPEDTIQVYLDLQNSQFLKRPIDEFSLTLNNFKDVSDFNFSSSLDLAFLSPHFSNWAPPIFKQWETQECKKGLNSFGLIFCDLKYSLQNSLFELWFKGSNLNISGNTITNFFLFGSLKDKIYTLHELIIDDIASSFEIIREDLFWDVKSFAFNFENSLLLGISGKYESGKCFQGKIDCMEANLFRVSGYFDSPSLKKLNLDGKIRGKGFFHLKEGKPFFDFKLSLKGSNICIGDFFLEEVPFFDLSLSSILGLQLKNVESSLRSRCKDLFYGHFHCKALKIAREFNALESAEMDFDISNEHLVDFSTALESIYFEKKSNLLKNVLAKLESSFVSQGSFSYKKIGLYPLLNINLKSGQYFLFGKDHKLKDILICFKDGGFFLEGDYFFDSRWLKLNINNSFATCEGGFSKEAFSFDDLLYQGSLTFKDLEKTLTMNYEMDAIKGFSLLSIDGNLSNISCRLFKEDNSKFLKGFLEFKFSEFLSLFSYARKGLEKISGDFRLEGLFDFNSPALFRGDFSGSDLTFGKNLISTLTSKLEFENEMAYFSDVVLQDPALLLTAPKATINAKNNDWLLYVPKVFIKKLAPGLLRKNENDPLFEIPFKIMQLDFKDLYGSLKDFPNTLKSFGRLKFTNFSRNKKETSVLAPASPCMANASWLEPAEGTVYFEVNNKKIKINELKDVYSEAKASKFFLADKESPSYIDFNGDLHLNIRMKHKNLFYKLAEIFMLSIRGNWFKPEVELQKMEKKGGGIKKATQRLFHKNRSTERKAISK